MFGRYAVAIVVFGGFKVFCRPLLVSNYYRFVNITIGINKFLSIDAIVIIIIFIATASDYIKFFLIVKKHR